jgi:hypothetical protein
LSLARYTDALTFIKHGFGCSSFSKIFGGFLYSHLAPRKNDVNLTHSTNPKTLILPRKAKKNTLRFIALLLAKPRVIRIGARSEYIYYFLIVLGDFCAYAITSAAAQIMLF